MSARREVENDEFFRFARRILKAAGQRVGNADPVDLADLVELRKEMERIEEDAVQMMRARYGYSWAEIGRDLGMTRQGAEQYYGRRARSRLAKDAG